MRPSPILCLVSNARSGSTALRNALAASGAFYDFGEIFHDQRMLTPFPFLDFLERWPSPIEAMLDRKQGMALATAYLRQLPYQASGLTPLIDIKHNAWGVLRPLWQFPSDQPLFLSALKSEKAMFILLRRENLAEQIMSYYIATRTDVWHASLVEKDLRRLGILHFDPVLARQLCLFFLHSEAMIESFLSNYPGSIVLTYETLFTRGKLSNDAAATLGAALGVEIRPVELTQKPNLIDKRNIISNYDEICEIAVSTRAERGMNCPKGA